MKKFAMFAILLACCGFTVGCGGDTTPPAAGDGGAAATPADGEAGDAAPAE